MNCRVDLSFLDLRAVPPLAALCLDTLSPDERERLGGYLDAMAARRFAIARLALRAVLAAGDDATATEAEAEVCMRDAAAIRFEVDASGKPRRADRDGPRFNVSHAGHRLAIACCTTHEVGVDVERSRPRAADARGSLRRVACAPSERVLLETLDARDPSAAEALFGRLWTRKEALAKALGAGLRLDFAGIDLSADVAAQAGFVDVTDPITGASSTMAWRDAGDAGDEGDEPVAVAVRLGEGEARGTVPGMPGAVAIDLRIRHLAPSILAPAR